MHDLVIRTAASSTAPAPRRSPATSPSPTAASPRSGRSTARPAATIDADGRLVTPGVVDIHTHYDGQAFWDADLTPSCWHGVTTVVMATAPSASRRARPSGATGSSR